MSSNREDFELWLKSKWDGDPLKAAQAEFRKTQEAAKHTDDAMKDMGYSAQTLKQELMGLLAVSEVIAQFKEGFEQVAALEQAMNELERQTSRNGDNFEVVSGKIVGFANQLKEVAGLDDDAAIKGMTRFYTATKDVEQALAMEALAADIAIGKRIDLAQAEDIVSKASVGQTKAIKDLMGGYVETGDAQKDAQAALDILAKTYGGAANKASGYTVELNRMSEKYEDVRNTLVERVMPSIVWFAKGIESIIIMLDSLFSAVMESLVRFAGGIGSVMSGAWKAMTGDFAGAKADFKRGADELGGIISSAADTAVAGAEKIKAVWASAGPGGGIDSQGKIRTLKGPGDGKAAKEAAEKAAKELEEIALAEFKFEQGLIKMRADAWEKFEASKRAMKKFSAKEDARLEKDLDKERERLMDAQTQRIRDEVMLRKQAEAAKLASAQQSTDAAISLGHTLFGESKGLAVAETVINTYRGATAASPNYVLMALLIAAGLANVAKIVATEPSTSGGGFDDPRNDAAARAGGRRWAMDMIGEFTGGVSAGWADGMSNFGGGGSSSTDNSRTYNIHFHGAGFLDPALVGSAKKLKRSLDVIDRTIDSQRTIARNR